MLGDAVAFEGIFIIVTFTEEIFAIKNLLRVTSLIFYPKSCNAKRCAISF